MRNYPVLAVCFLLFSASPAAADFYRWVDNEGKVFYTNNLKQIPEEYQGSATVVNPDPARVSVGEKPSPTAGTPSVKEHKDKYGKGEEYWRKRADKVRSKLRDQQDEYDLVVKQLDDRDQKPRKTTGKKKKARTTLEKKKVKLEKDIVKTRRMLEVDLPEEARRADAYPGWIRE